MRRGAEEEQALDTGVAAGLDDVGLKDEVVADEVSGIGAVGQDAADPAAARKTKSGLSVVKNASTASSSRRSSSSCVQVRRLRDPWRSSSRWIPVALGCSKNAY